MVRPYQELWHFGHSNAPGDTIVYVPDAKVAWSGNYLPAAGLPPMLLEGGPEPYIESLKMMKRTLDAEIVMPGHGPIAEARASIDSLLSYLNELRDNVGRLVAAGKSLHDTMEAFPLPERLRPPADLPAPPEAKAEMRQLFPDMHRLNVLSTFRAMEGSNEMFGSPR